MRRAAGDNRLADIFHEVDEDLRRERLRSLWDRFGIYLIVLIVLIVAGIGGWRGYEYWQNQKAAEAGTAFEAAMALADAGKYQEAEQAFARIAETATPGYRTLARLRGAEAVAQRDRAAAVAAYDAIAADSAVGSRFRDLASVRAGFLLVDTATFPDMEKRLEPLASPQRAFRHTAREILTVSAFRAGDQAAMRRWADTITNDAESPAAMRARVEAMLALEGGQKG